MSGNPNSFSAGGWESFVLGVAEGWRYFADAQAKSFLRAMVDYVGEAKDLRLDPKQALYRACIGCETSPSAKAARTDLFRSGQSPTPHSPERLLPTSKFAGNGRLGVKGIPLLYLSDSARTAVSEVRPFIDDLVTVGLFQPNEGLRIADFRCPSETAGVLSQVTRENGEPEIAWLKVALEMATPVRSETSEVDYRPTQVVAEYLRCAGFDGIAYSSSMTSGGTNYAFFDLNAAVVISSSVQLVTTLAPVLSDFPTQEAYTEELSQILVGRPNGFTRSKDRKK